MKTTTNPQLGLLDSLMPSAPGNDFLEKLESILNWRPLEEALQAMYPAITGRPPCAPLALFKMSLLQHCYGLSDPQCEELVADRLSWRRFVGLGLHDAVPDETTPVRFRQRLREHGLHERLLALVNRQLERKGLILKTCTLVDATLLQAARRAPSKDDRTGGDPDADFTVRNGTVHYGYKAHVAVDETHTLIRNATMTSARVQDCCEFLHVVKGDEEMVVADKAYWSAKHSQWCGRHRVANGIMRKAQRGEKLPASVHRTNRLFGAIRCKIETIFGWWKRSAAYRRVRYVGWQANRLELEFKCISWNLKRMAGLAAA
jgi:IS5 family transposase